MRFSKDITKMFFLIMNFQNEVREGMVSMEHNAMFVANMTFEKFDVAVKLVHPAKAAGPDGLNPALFQHFWGLLVREVIWYYKNWFQECSFPA